MSCSASATLQHCCGMQLLDRREALKGLYSGDYSSVLMHDADDLITVGDETFVFFASVPPVLQLIQLCCVLSAAI